MHLPVKQTATVPFAPPGLPAVPIGPGAPGVSGTRGGRCPPGPASVRRRQVAGCPGSPAASKAPAGSAGSAANRPSQSVGGAPATHGGVRQEAPDEHLGHLVTADPPVAGVPLLENQAVVAGRGVVEPPGSDDRVRGSAGADQPLGPSLPAQQPGASCGSQVGTDRCPALLFDSAPAQFSQRSPRPLHIRRGAWLAGSRGESHRRLRHGGRSTPRRPDQSRHAVPGRVTSRFASSEDANQTCADCAHLRTSRFRMTLG